MAKDLRVQKGDGGQGLGAREGMDWGRLSCVMPGDHWCPGSPPQQEPWGPYLYP